MDALTLSDPSSLPMVGREPEQRLLTEALTSAKRRNRSAWLVRGPLGIGKSKLLDWLADEAEKEGIRVRRGSGLKGVATPFGVFQQVFRGSPMAALASSGEPTMTVMLHYLTLLERDAASNPLMVLIDDLQSADADSARMFQFLARNTKGLPVVLVAALETEVNLPAADDVGPDLLELLHSMEREGLVSTIRLERLGREQIRKIAENFAAAHFAPSPLLEELLDVLDRAGGNPYHIIATVRSLSEGGQLSQHRGGMRLGGSRANGVTRRQFGLPSDARAAVERRMGLLTDDELGLIQAAAVLGPEFRIEPVAAVLGKDLADVVELTKRLTADQRFITGPTTRAGTWSFAHPITWHAVLDSLEPGDRARMAGTFAKWWSQHRPEEVEIVAQLYSLANDRDEGPAWAAKALDRAFQHGSPELVERSFRWMQAFSAVQPPEYRARQGLEVFDRLIATKGVSPVALRMLEALLSFGDLPLTVHTELESRRALAICQLRGPKDAEAVLAGTLERSAPTNRETSPGLRARVQLARGAIAYYQGKTQEAARALREAQLAARRAGLPAVRSYSLYLLGLSLIGMNRLDAARDVSIELKSVAADIRRTFPRSELYPLGLAAVVAERRGAVLESIRAFESVQALAWECDDLTNATVSRANLAAAYNDAMLFDKALEAAKEAEALASRFGLLQAQALAWATKGDALVNLGSYQEGRELLDRAASFFGVNEWAPRRLECQIIIAHSLLAAGKITEGLALLMRLSPELGILSPRPRILFYAYRAEAHRHLKSGVEANADLKVAWKISTESGDWLGQSIVMAERARLEQALGRSGHADKMWRDAQALYRRCGFSTPISQNDQHPETQTAPGVDRTSLPSGLQETGRLRATLGPHYRAQEGHGIHPMASAVGEGRDANPAPLSLSQKVVAHIALQARVREDELASVSLTQTGMSAALNRPQGVLAKVLHRLESAGLARSEARHVRGGSRRVKVYQLTPQGEALAKEVRRAPAA